MSVQTANRLMSVDELVANVKQFWQDYALKRGIFKVRVDPYEIAAGLFKPSLKEQFLADDIDWSFNKYIGETVSPYHAIILELDAADSAFTLKLVKRNFKVDEWQKPKYYQPMPVKRQNFLNEEILAEKTYQFNGTPDEVFAAYRGQDPVYLKQ